MIRKNVIYLALVLLITSCGSDFGENLHSNSLEKSIKTQNGISLIFNELGTPSALEVSDPYEFSRLYFYENSGNLDRREWRHKGIPYLVLEDIQERSRFTFDLNYFPKDLENPLVDVMFIEDSILKIETAFLPIEIFTFTFNCDCAFEPINYPRGLFKKLFSKSDEFNISFSVINDLKDTVYKQVVPVSEN